MLWSDLRVKYTNRLYIMYILKMRVINKLRTSVSRTLNYDVRIIQILLLRAQFIFKVNATYIRPMQRVQFNNDNNDDIIQLQCAITASRNEFFVSATMRGKKSSMQITITKQVLSNRSNGKHTS